VLQNFNVVVTKDELSNLLTYFDALSLLTTPLSVNLKNQTEQRFPQLP
jgi:hypothetical protein